MSKPIRTWVRHIPLRVQSYYIPNWRFTQNGGYLLRHITTTRAPKKIARSDNPNSTTRNGVTSGCAVATGTWVGCGARQVMHALGHSGNKVLLRVIGLIVMAIAVEFFLNRS